MLKQLLLFLKIYVHSYVVFPTKHNSNITFSYSCLFFLFYLVLCILYRSTCKSDSPPYYGILYVLNSIIIKESLQW